MRPPGKGLHTANHNDRQIQFAFERQDWRRLVSLCRKTLQAQPGHLRAHRLLGFALKKQGDNEGATRAFLHAVQTWPSDAEIRINQAQFFFEGGNFGLANEAFKRVCELRPQDPLAWIKYAQSCYPIQLNQEGFRAAETALALNPTDTDRSAVLNQRAIHRRELGQTREAVFDCGEAIRLNPHDLAPYQNRLLFMLADPDCSDDQLAHAARDYGQVTEEPLRAHWPEFEELRHGPWRKLRIAFFSPDMRVHSVMYFLEGVLAQLDRRQFEVWAIYLHPTQDYVTERVKCHADRFVSLANCPHDQQTAQIRAWGIDILVDLAGHTGHNGLFAMAHRAAPIQASWIGFPGSTGLQSMDYLITDAATDPPGVEHLYTETLWRLPTRLCVYRPMSRNPLARYEPRYFVRPSPVLTHGGITFGSCNNLGKLTDQVLTTWGKIILATPGSRLLIEGKNFDKLEFAQAYRDRCEHLGIPPDRLTLVPLRMENQYLTYHEIDIALDPFPLNGGTTSMDVLWMGVPLVALEGSAFKSRLTTGILVHLNRREWLAKTIDEYIEIACRLASNPEALNKTRHELRHELEHSVLMDEQHFNQVLGQAFRGMWLRWLGSETESIAAPPEPLQQPAPLGVGMAPGRRITLSQAHQELVELTERCKQSPPNAEALAQQTATGPWKELTDYCERVLNAVPHDAVALSCLAEVELAYGKTDFACAYLHYAQASLARLP